MADWKDTASMLLIQVVINKAKKMTKAKMHTKSTIVFDTLQCPNYTLITASLVPSDKEFFPADAARCSGEGLKCLLRKESTHL